MQIDRQRFLLLASSLAVGCGAAGDVPAEIPVATPRELEGGVDEEPQAEVPAEPETPVPSGDSTDGLRDQLAQRCDALREPSGPFCEGFDETVELCGQFADMLKPAAARQAVACLDELSGSTAICGYEAAEDCFTSGLSMGSATSDATRRCREVMSRCSASRWRSPELNEAACLRAASAVRADKVDDLVACMREGCGIKRCVYDLMD